MKVFFSLDFGNGKTAATLAFLGFARLVRKILTIRTHLFLSFVGGHVFVNSTSALPTYAVTFIGCKFRGLWQSFCCVNRICILQAFCFICSSDGDSHERGGEFANPVLLNSNMGELAKSQG